VDVLANRVEAIFSSLDAVYQGGVGASSASKGAERELFVKHVLETVFPQHFRFASGDIIDSYRSQTGQVDVVLEHARGYSFPLAQSGPRLFLAENVAAVIEVKSDLTNQWNEAIATGEKVAEIRRKYSSDKYRDLARQLESGQINAAPGTDIVSAIEGLNRMAADPKNVGKQRIRYFVVGFKGWGRNNTIVEKLVPDVIDGIFQLNDRKFVTKLGRAPGREVIEGTGSLLAFLHWLELSFFDTAERFPAYSEYE